MPRRAQFTPALFLLFVAAALLAAQEGASRRGAPAAKADSGQLDAEQIRALVKRAIELQQQNHEALEEYDRTERVVNRDRNQEITDITARVVPTGTGTARVVLERNGQPVSAEEIAKSWRWAAEVLEEKSRANDPRVKRDYERAARRRRETAQLVEAIGEAFRFRWVGRTMRGGRPTIELEFEPEPGFKPSSRYAGMYKHIWGRAWVDESTGQVSRLEAELRRDVSFVAGIVGKIYSGSRIEIEQAEAAPGIWLPSHHSYDIEGRKFVFRASVHRKLDASGYRRVGPPAEALALIRREHARADQAGLGRPSH